ncbi:MAG: hypothetical protein A3H32_18020 [Betaproteobacteria bacterium RIFCSPLOWO2_02_FULL_63_19]|nr:MAG: hypothetical protein A3H32_18020 [Betaproteobacteria bacterium RIFCSPLOWO2_02_FULL_63_19]
MRIDGHPVQAVTYVRMRALLAYLAVERERDHPRADLAAMLWPGNDHVTARGNLRRTLADLRRTLETPLGMTLFIASKDAIRLVPAFSIDVRDFVGGGARNVREALPDEAAIALYRGEFLAGLSLPDCPQFEEWVSMHREALHCHALALLERLWRRYSMAGNYGEALRFVLRHAELEPWDEDVHRQAMLLYARNGQKSAALEQYAICRRMLREELASSPSKETEQLAERIRNGEWNASLPVQVQGQNPSGSSPPPQAERRPVTVLYCELIPAETEDPDEAAQVLGPPRERCLEIIRRHSGYVASTHGGGLLAYFGYPRADENAARHAVRAALAITRAAAPEIEIRVGIHSGLVIAGGQPDLPDAVGRTSKLAARLRHSAAKNQVSISQQTRHVVAGYFDCISLGLQHVSGFSQPLEVFRVNGETGARTRLDGVERLTPLFGRQAEIEKLLALWQEARNGSRQFLCIRGEPGIGKTRLVRALIERIEGDSDAVCELRCFPEFEQSPFHPVIAMIEARLGFPRTDTPEDKFRKLSAHFETRYRKSAPIAVPLLARLLSIALQGNYRAPPASPQKQKEQIIALLLDQLNTPPSEKPALLIVEDLHWIDPSSLELLHRFIERKDGRPVFAVFTHRPEFVAPWMPRGVSILDIAPLTERDARQMIASISGQVPAATARLIVESSDGVPLFIEEMTKLARTDNSVGIPPTLHDLLAARIDRLGSAKYTAQLAATLGREFDLTLLGKVFPKERGNLQEALRALREAGLTLELNASTQQFKHALIREAAYQSQTKADIQAAHQRVAEVLMREFPDVVASRPEQLAQHLSASGQTRLAIEYWTKAGQRAAQYSAHAEAIKNFNNGLRLLPGLQPGSNRDLMEFNILVNLCPSLYAAVGYGSEEATRANARLAVLADLVGDAPDLFQAKWAVVMNTIANAGSRDVPPRAMHLLHNAGDDPLRRQAAHYAVADAAFWLGKFEVARAHTEESLTFYRSTQHQDLLARFGEDLSVSCAAYLAWAYHFLGHAERARLICDKMLGRARELDHPHTLALALCFASVLHRWMDDRENTLILSTETIEVSRKYGFSVWLAAGEMTHGWALARHGRHEGIAELDSSVAGMKKAIGGISVVFLSALAEAYFHLALYDRSLATVEAAKREAARTGDGHFSAELCRIEGECLLATSAKNAPRAKACFNQARSISRAQGAKSLELLVEASMARMR